MIKTDTNNGILKLAFLGDIVLNGQYVDMYKQGIKPFKEVANVLNNYNVVGNFECFAKGSKGENDLKKPRLETNIETLNYVNDFNLNIACLANNHVFDHLEDGFKKTIDFLNKNDIKTIGASIDKGNYDDSLIIDKAGIKIALLNYVSSDTNPNPPSDTSIHLNFFKEEKILIDIEKVRTKADHIVLCLHWGGRLEGGLYPDWEQPTLARKFIDAGADLIIGHHSHTIQPYEVYKGKYIFYSIGNFCFSNFKFEGISYWLSNRQKQSLIPLVTFHKNKYKIELTYYYNNNGILKQKNKKNKKNILFKVISNNYIAWRFYYFWYKKITPAYILIFNKHIPFNEKIKSFSIKRIFKHLTK